MRRTTRKAVATAIVGWGVAVAADAAEPPRPRATPVPVADLRLERLEPVVDRRLRVDDPGSRLRTGFGGGLVSLFPVAGSGFHLSAGGRLFGRPVRDRAMEARGLAPATGPRGGGWRGGRRGAPAFLMGIDRPAGTAVSLGVDAGVVLGPAMDRGPRMPRASRLGGPPAGANGVARVTMGLRF